MSAMNNTCTRPCNRMEENKQCDFNGCTYFHSVYQARFIPCREKINCKKFTSGDCQYYHDTEDVHSYVKRRFGISEETHGWMYRHPFFNHAHFPIPSSIEERQYLTLSIEQEYIKRLGLSQAEIENEMEEVLDQIKTENDEYDEEYDDMPDLVLSEE